MTLLLLLVALNILVPVWVVCRFCITRAGVEVNHLLMFTSGYLFYWILPIAVGVNHWFDQEPDTQIWYQLFDTVHSDTLGWYLIITLACYAAFAAGTLLTTRWFVQGGAGYRPTFFSLRLLEIPLFIALLASAIYTFILRAEFFHGYAGRDETSSGVETRGPFVAWSVFLLALAFIYSAKRDEDSGFTAPFRDVIRNRYFFCYLVVSLLVLSLGGRLYFVSGLVILLVYGSVYFQRIPLRLALAALAGLIIVSGLVGLVRVNSDFSATGALLNVFSESIFTSFSLIHFLGDGTFEWVKFPVFLLSSLVNLLPTALLPDKANLIVAPEDYGYVAFAPVGALNSYFSFMINFGILGTMAFLFLFSCFLNYLKVRDRRLLFRVMYGMLTGWIGFTFFRDAFFISIIKTMLQFSVLTPWAIVITAQLLSVALRARPARPDAPTKESVPT